jgi:acetyl esterase/lipase
LIWYKSDGFFRTDSRPYDNWTAWLADQTKTRPINPATNPIFVHGESAGGHAVVTSMFLNAEKSVGLDLPIKIALLRYPMVKHYTRLFPATGTLTYMGKSVTHAETIARRRAFEREIWLLEKYGLVPARSKGFAPQWMSCAFVLATTGRWKTMFQRSHGPYTQALIEGNADLGAEIAWPAVGSENEGSWDCVERAKGSMDKVGHGKLPRVVMYHGTGDGNCPVGDTRELRDVLIEKYPGRYNEETAFLEERETLQGKEGPVDHAFDYNLEVGNEKWLKEIFEKVDEAWLKG